MLVPSPEIYNHCAATICQTASYRFIGKLSGASQTVREGFGMSQQRYSSPLDRLMLAVMAAVPVPARPFEASRERGQCGGQNAGTGMSD
jgi:hypothetical protein